MNFGELLYAQTCEQLKNNIRKNDNETNELFKLKMKYILTKCFLYRVFRKNVPYFCIIHISS